MRVNSVSVSLPCSQIKKQYVSNPHGRFNTAIVIALFLRLYINERSYASLSQAPKYSFSVFAFDVHWLLKCLILYEHMKYIFLIVKI